jgi:hypothetical protein
MFHDVTGFTLLAEPHRQADRAALGIAREWIGFDPLFTLGLLASKAERLLVHERALLYWPLFRASVLPEAEREFFARHRSSIETITDDYWLAVLALAFAGCGVAYARRQWLALALLPPAAVLVALYTAIFSEPRYRLPVSMLLMPLAALALDWLLSAACDLRRKPRPPGLRRQAVLAAAVPVVIFTLAPLLASAGERLRASHGWAVTECQIAGQPRLCSWRPVAGGAVKGVWNGVGIALPAASTVTAAAETEIRLEPGGYLLSVEVDVTSSPRPAQRGEVGGHYAAKGESLTLTANGKPLGSVVAVRDLPDAKQGEQALVWKGSLHHEGGPLRVGARIESPAGAAATSGRVWLGNLRLDPEAESRGNGGGSAKPASPQE